VNPPTDIAGVVVTHFPDAGFEHRLAAIAREVGRVIVVDNSGDQAVQLRLREACAVHRAEFIPNPTNRGLAAALNHGFRLLAARGLTAAIAFDQDSTPAPGFSAALLATMSAVPRPAVVGANWQDEATPAKPSRHLRPHAVFPVAFERVVAGRDLNAVTCVIASGSLYDLGLWDQLGGFDERLFLDLVDTEYCLRARAAGHLIAVAAAARLAHRRGAKKSVRRFGRTWTPAFMPPVRLHYLFRNRMRLLARHGIQVPHWTAFELVYAVKILAEILFLEDAKLAKLSGCMRGAWNGVTGRSGPIDPT
jgi:rhamnosyltransferase